LTAITKTSYRSKLGLIVLAYIAFISLGMPDGLFGVAWPSIREHFGLRLDSIGAFFFAGTTGYMFSSFFSGKVMSRLGVGGTLAASCVLTASALLGYTLVPSWWMMVLLAVASGLGAGAIDAGLNTYVASHFGEGLMQWLHASFGVGVTMGPIIMTTGLTVFGSWQLGYRAVGIAQLLLALSFLLTMRMWQNNNGAPHAPEQERHLMDYRTPFRETLRQPAVWLNLLLFLLTRVPVFLRQLDVFTAGSSRNGEWRGGWGWQLLGMFTVGRILAVAPRRGPGSGTASSSWLAVRCCGGILPAGTSLPSLRRFAIVFPGIVSEQARVGESMPKRQDADRRGGLKRQCRAWPGVLPGILMGDPSIWQLCSGVDRHLLATEPSVAA
jgi:MFS family permease